MNELLQYRFPATDDPDAPGAPGLGGHAVGNLLIAAMTDVEGGDFEEGVRQMNRILAVRGQVLPVSATPLTLHARLDDGIVVDGQSVIMRTTGIERVWLTPGDVEPSEDALAAIAEAELIVLGPGSLYTSLLPSLLIPGIRDAVLAVERRCASSPATSRPRPARPRAWTSPHHVEALVAHTAPGIVDVVLANNQFDARVPDDWTAQPVRLRWPPAVEPGRRGSSSTRSSTRRTPTTTTRRGWPRACSASLEREGGARRRAVAPDGVTA